MIRLIDSLLTTLGRATSTPSGGSATALRRATSTPAPTPAKPTDRPSLEQELVFGHRAARSRGRRRAARP